MSVGDTSKKSKKQKVRTDPVAYEPPDHGNGKPPRRKRDEVAEELLRELKELRTNLDELTEHFKLRIAGELAEITQAIEGKAIQAKPKRLPVKVTAAMLKAVQEQAVKPRKGRAKDLAKLQNLVRTLAALLPPED